MPPAQTLRPQLTDLTHSTHVTHVTHVTHLTHLTLMAADPQPPTPRRRHFLPVGLPDKGGNALALTPSEAHVCSGVPGSRGKTILLCVLVGYRSKSHRTIAALGRSVKPTGSKTRWCSIRDQEPTKLPLKAESLYPTMAGRLNATTAFQAPAFLCRKV